MKDLFPIPILHEKIPLQNNNLFEQIKAARVLLDEDIHYYTSFYEEDPMKGIEWSTLRETILLTARKYIMQTTSEEHSRTSNLKIHAWWNLYEQGTHHCWHSHSNVRASGTYYVYTDKNTVPIEFKSPIESLIKSWDPTFGVGTRWSQENKIYPEPGDILIWPPFVEHQVPLTRKANNNLRCTVSFNIQ